LNHTSLEFNELNIRLKTTEEKLQTSEEKLQTSEEKINKIYQSYTWKFLRKYDQLTKKSK